MSAFYNERDPYAAAWLRNLIAAGHIAPGVVDERDIRDIEPDELRSFTQCHFFAGIGIWSAALRSAGWADDRPVWTGSCPCQPFSAAGQRKGIADERHLWPAFYHLIAECRPAIVLGEQVASKDGRIWLDTVSADLEALDLAFGASDLCAAGFGGAHVRQRLYFCGIEGLDHPAGARRKRAQRGAESDPRDQARLRLSGAGKPDGGLANRDHARLEGRGGVHGGADQCAAGPGSVAGRVASADLDGPCARGLSIRPGRQDEGKAEQSGFGEAGRAPHAPLLGREAVDWLLCRDGKWRPVDPGTFPLADADKSRVGRLRAYGNALDQETAAQFCGAVIDSLTELRP